MYDYSQNKPATAPTAPNGQPKRWFQGYRFVQCGPKFGGFFFVDTSGNIQAAPPGFGYWVGKRFTNWRHYARNKWGPDYAEGKGHREYMGLIAHMQALLKEPLTNTTPEIAETPK